MKFKCNPKSFKMLFESALQNYLDFYQNQSKHVLKSFNVKKEFKLIYEVSIKL